MEKVGGDQNNYVYKGRLIVSVFEHKLYIAHTTFQDWICSIIFLVLLSFLNGWPNKKPLWSSRASLII